MYNFIFFFIYSQQMQKAKSETFSRFNGSLIVAFAFIVHIAFVLAIFRKVFLGDNEGYGVINYFGELSIAVLAFTIVHLYYSKNRVRNILKKHHDELLAINGTNSFKILTLLLLPLIVAAVLSTG